jgi:hypothetical protein
MFEVVTVEQGLRLTTAQARTMDAGGSGGKTACLTMT